MLKITCLILFLTVRLNYEIGYYDDTCDDKECSQGVTPENMLHLHTLSFLWVKLCLFTKAYFFNAIDLNVPGIIRMACLILSDWYGLTIIIINVAYPCVAWGYAEIMFEGLLQVVGIKLYSGKALK